MYRPCSTAAWEAPAGFEAESARATAGTMTEEALLSGTLAIPGQASMPAPESVAGPVAMAGIPSGRMLPCTDDPDLFFAESPEDVEAAKELCQGCPARIACLSGAIERREPWGVWGGELFLRGEIVPRKRPRGRPRKTEVAA
jgi:WhiB family transcriptional regulator, redox-sensing transcriptional regulator